MIIISLTHTLNHSLSNLINECTAVLVGWAQHRGPQTSITLGHKIARKVLEQRVLVAHTDQVVTVATMLIADEGKLGVALLAVNTHDRTDISITQHKSIND